eukprot:2976633-Amphidinium_carterae.1
MSNLSLTDMCEGSLAALASFSRSTTALIGRLFFLGDAPGTLYSIVVSVVVCTASAWSLSVAVAPLAPTCETTSSSIASFDRLSFGVAISVGVWMSSVARERGSVLALSLSLATPPWSLRRAPMPAS